MRFGLGPVVRYELITTARRGRFYIARVAYGLSLLVLLGNEFRGFDAMHPAGGTAEEVQTFAESAFIQFAWAQGMALMCLIPALIAGVIADEHQRKTLHYLLASRLSSAEIVLGKLGARMVHVAAFVALGVPVVCLLALYGGLNPENVCFIYIGTFSTVVFASGLCILISIMARRPRDAILAAYSIGAVWLVVPLWIEPIARFLDDGPLWWVRPINEWVLMTNPAIVWESTPVRFIQFGRLRTGWFLGGFATIFYWMVALQLILGVLFLTLAVLGLRPLRGSSWPGAQPQTGWWSRLAARAQAFTRAKATAALTRNELLTTPVDRPSCGDDPMIWKERHTSSGGGLRWLGSRPIVLFFSVLLGCYLLDVASPVVLHAFSGQGGWFRTEVTEALRGSSMVLAVLGMLGIAASAAVSLTGEREQDTWTSLATTLLTPAEIIRAKQFGALWSARRVGLALLVIWAVGLLLGAIHPVGVLACALYIAVIAWLVAATGVLASSFARNSTRALITTFILLLILSGISRWPWVGWRLLFSGEEVKWSGSQSPFEAFGQFEAVQIALGFVLFLAIHVVIALLLFLAADRRLHATWGR
jgi:ABC-type transport system involved in multi-copper enzyme maturation permease subunit